MIGRYLVTELGQTWCAVFHDDRIVVAGLVDDTSPDALGDVSEGLFTEWVLGLADDTLKAGAWLEREHVEGRATIIQAHFEVSA